MRSRSFLKPTRGLISVSSSVLPNPPISKLVDDLSATGKGYQVSELFQGAKIVLTNPNRVIFQRPRFLAIGEESVQPGEDVGHLSLFD